MYLGQITDDAGNVIATGTTAPSGDTFSSIISSLPSLVSQGLTAYGQLQLQNMNMALIKQGKPPLTASQIYAMAPQLNVGLASSTQNLLMYGALGAGALLLIMSAMKRKRR